MPLDSLLGASSKRNLPKIATAFAAGGLAGASAMAIPLQPDIQPAVTNQQSSSQVFEINITGDVSRQTRAEIQKMLPSIAQGVNTHNRYKR
jgi:hypothetical protein